MMILFALAENVPSYLTDTVALAAVAVIGYLFGHRTREEAAEHFDECLHSELSRATKIAKELQYVAGRIRREVARHQSNIATFQSRIGKLQSKNTADGWVELGEEAEALLAPTVELSTNLSAAYDQLRKHCSQLTNFAGSRTDSQTGVGNRKALEEQIDVQFSLHAQNPCHFSLALFRVEPPCDDPLNDLAKIDFLHDFAQTLENCVRDTDLVARYSSDEFAILMPQTTLSGATVFSTRFLQLVDSESPGAVVGGIVEVQEEDTPEKLFSRVDSALYSARTNGRSCLFQHDGKTIRELDCPLEAGSLESASDPEVCFAGVDEADEVPSR